MSLNGRLDNSSNSHQGKRKRVLCVCSAGLLRSPTAAWIMSNAPFDFNTRAAGMNPAYALVVVDLVLLAWADEIVCMDKHQARDMQREIDAHNMNLDTFYQDTINPKIHVLDCPDIYGFRDPKLVQIMEDKLTAIFLKDAA